MSYNSVIVIRCFKIIDKTVKLFYCVSSNNRDY